MNKKTRLINQEKSDVRGMCNFLGSVLPQQNFEVMDRPVLQLGVTARLQLSFIWQAKENRSTRHGSKRSEETQFWLPFLDAFSALCKLG